MNTLQSCHVEEAEELVTSRPQFDVPENFKEIEFNPLPSTETTVTLENQENFLDRKLTFTPEVASSIEDEAQELPTHAKSIQSEGSLEDLQSSIDSENNEMIKVEIQESGKEVDGDIKGSISQVPTEIQSFEKNSNVSTENNEKFIEVVTTETISTEFSSFSELPSGEKIEESTIEMCKLRKTTYEAGTEDISQESARQEIRSEEIPTETCTLTKQFSVEFTLGDSKSEKNSTDSCTNTEKVSEDLKSEDSQDIFEKISKESTTEKISEKSPTELKSANSQEISEQLSEESSTAQKSEELVIEITSCESIEAVSMDEIERSENLETLKRSASATTIESIDISTSQDYTELTEDSENELKRFSCLVEETNSEITSRTVFVTNETIVTEMKRTGMVETNKITNGKLKI